MSAQSDPEINALALSQLGQSIDACIKAERADLDQALARYGSHMEQVNQRLAEIARFMTEPQAPPEEWLKPLADLHLAITDTLAQSAETVSQLVTFGATYKAQTEAEADWKVDRVTLVHKAQLEAMQAKVAVLQEDQRRMSADNARLGAELEDARLDVAKLADVQTLLRKLGKELPQQQHQQRELTGMLALQHQKLIELTGHNERMQERLAAYEEAAKQAKAHSESLAERLAVLKRNVRARDAMFREEAAQIRMAEKELAVREAGRAVRAEQRLAALAIRHGDWSGEVLSMAVDDRSHFERGIAWLALNAPASMLNTAIADPAFEHACAFAIGEHDFVTASYRWLLGRPHDEAGMAHYLRQLQSGVTRRDVLIDLALSEEAAARLHRLIAQLPEEIEEFVESAYKAILERPADVQGSAHYRHRLESGGNRQGVLLDLARSGEAQAKPLAGALRCTAALRGRRRTGFLRRTAYRLVGLHHPELKRAWKAGRLAAIAGDAERAWEKVQQRIADLQTTANARVAAAEGRIRLDAASGERTAPHAQILSAPISVIGELETTLRMLEDNSANRTPPQILSAIRAELTTARRL